MKTKTINALSWNFLESVGLKGIQFLITIVLARILYPEQFGLMGMLTIFIAVAQTLYDSGFGAALIQKREVNQVELCSVFYINILLALLIAGILCIVAPWIAEFYKETILTPMTRLLSLTIVINSLGLIQSIIFTKEINFKKQTQISLIANVLSGSSAIVMAVNGYGVWSLVIQQIINASVVSVCLWCLSPWRPSYLFSIDALWGMYNYGSRLFMSRLLYQVFDNIYYLVIGRLFSVTALGLFTRARALQETPTHILAGVSTRVTFPIFSSIQDDVQKIKRGLKKALILLTLVNFPLMIGMIVVAKPMVLLLLTEKWLGCVTYLQLLCLVGLLYPVHAINLNVLQSLGRSDLFLRLEIIKQLLIVINIILTWKLGIEAMIIGMFILSIISWLLHGYYIRELINYSLKEQLLDIIPYMIISLVMGSLVYGIGLYSFQNELMLLVTQIVSGIAIYILLCRVYCPSVFMELWNESRRKICMVRNEYAR